MLNVQYLRFLMYKIEYVLLSSFNTINWNRYLFRSLILAPFSNLFLKISLGKKFTIELDQKEYFLLENDKFINHVIFVKIFFYQRYFQSNILCI